MLSLWSEAACLQIPAPGTPTMAADQGKAEVFQLWDSNLGVKDWPVHLVTELNALQSVSAVMELTLCPPSVGYLCLSPSGL